MTQYEWQNLIVAAASNPDTAQLESLALHLADCEEAKTILRNKGYGTAGQSIVVMVRPVPNKREW